ncbi:MAG: hypothetical protein HZB17_02655, partial [Chloroflexi bacterium]|nr:hypothetical protein [Chloroflexota bacterium]
MRHITFLMIAAALIASCSDRRTPTQSVLFVRVTTPTPSQTKPTVTPTLAPSPIASPKAMLPETQIKTFNSPDGLWVAESHHRMTDSDQDDQVRLVVRKADKSVEWVALDRKDPKGLGQELPTVHKWSNTMQYLYFGNAATSDGCALFDYSPDLYRLDLRDGSVIEILSPIAINLSLSPDENLLAYFNRAGNLVLRDLFTRLESHIHLPFENL